MARSNQDQTLKEKAAEKSTEAVIVSYAFSRRNPSKAGGWQWWWWKMQPTTRAKPTNVAHANTFVCSPTSGGPFILIKLP